MKRGPYRKTLANGNWKLAKALQFITNRTTETKAIERFRPFYRRNLNASIATLGQYTPESLEANLSKDLDAWRSDGMPAHLVELFRAKFLTDQQKEIRRIRLEVAKRVKSGKQSANSGKQRRGPKRRRMTTRKATAKSGIEPRH